MRNFDSEVVSDLATRALGNPARAEAAVHGVSSDIYKVNFGKEVAYLKLSGTAETTLLPEYLVYEQLNRVGVQVPRVLYFLEEDSGINRSVMILSEIPGHPVRDFLDSPERQQALFEAGIDIAKINSIPLGSYGWVDFSKGVKEIKGTCADLAEYTLAGVQEGIKGLVEFEILSPNTAERCQQALANRQKFLTEDFPHLAHGDFDDSHIFFDGQRYSGIIDFGDISGASQYRDLAHLKVFSKKLFPEVLRGYQQVTNLPNNALEQISFEAVAILLGKVNWVLKKKIDQIEKYRWAEPFIVEQLDLLNIQ